MKKVLFLLVFVFFGFGLVFSGGQAEDGEMTIRFMTRDVPSTTEDVTTIGNIWERAIEEFEEMNPGVTIENESISDDSAYEDSLQSDIAAGEPPHIFGLPGIANLVEYAEGGLIADFAPYLEADPEWSDGFVRGSVEMFDFSGYGTPGIYSLPFALNPEPWFYNKSLFEEAGIDEEPETWPEFLEVVDQLRAADITPIGIGNQNTWRAGHIHTGILYKYAGVSSAIELGQRERSYTDSEIVESFQLLQDLNERDAFQSGFSGTDYETEVANFIRGEHAMMYNGLWIVGRLTQEMGGAENVGTFLMPHFPDREEYRNHDITYPSQFLVSGLLSEEEEEMAMEFVKYLTGPEVASWLANDAQSNPARTDYDVDRDAVGDLWLEVTSYMGDFERTGHDSFAYDPIPAVEFYVKDQIAGMLEGRITPEEGAEIIADFIESEER